MIEEIGEKAKQGTASVASVTELAVGASQGCTFSRRRPLLCLFLGSPWLVFRLGEYDWR